jgi:murein DD-endopeptidase MepM/ murein hydrolase activator NlpD
MLGGLMQMKKLMLYCLIFIMALVYVVPASADKLSEANSKKSSVTKKLDSVTKKQAEVKRQIQEKSAEQKNLLSVEQKKTLEYKRLQAEKKALDELLLSIDTQLTESEQRYAKQEEMLKIRLKVMYENSNISYIQTLIQSKSIIDFYERLQLISIISKSDREMVKSLSEAKKDVEYKKQIKEQQKKETESKARDKAKAISQINISRANVEDDIQGYKLQLDQLEKQEDELIKQSDAINREIKNLMSKKIYFGGIMRWPISLSYTSISSSFGNRYHPVLKKYKLHTGIDIRAGTGVSITAAAKGKVIVSGWRTGYGNTVIIDHGGGIATLYGHASKLLVNVGNEVKAGQTIAKVGSTGWSTGPHLHFEVIKNSSPVNPLKYVTSR